MRTSSGRQSRPVTQPTKCKSCGADILWAEHRTTKKKMPFDSEPDMRPPPKGGNLVVTLVGGDFGKLVCEVYNSIKHEGRNRYTSHFVTCPESKEWRKS